MMRFYSSVDVLDHKVHVKRMRGVPVKFFTHELSVKGRLRRLLIRNATSRIYSTVFDLCIKSLVCLLYVARVLLDDPATYSCGGRACFETNVTSGSDGSSRFTSTNINWHVLVWVSRPWELWGIMLFLSVITLAKACLYIAIASKGRLLDHVLTHTFLLEVLCSVPMIATACYPQKVKDLFIPLFLNCWLARVALRRLMNDLHLTKTRFQTMSVTLWQQGMLLSVTLCCFVFTTICGIQHIQRGSNQRSLNMFEAVYFTVVTFSTVGYGDISPDIWLGQLFMFLMICVAFAFIPKKLEEIGSTWAQRKKTGGDYTKRQSARSKHIVVCSTSFTIDIVMNFLNEFYEHPKLEEHTVVLMSSDELDSNMLFILKDPKWANRVLYIRGSALKDIDLKRCRVHDAEAVFFLLNKTGEDKDKSDQHTILRSWAVKDFAPSCRQYIQLFQASNKMHVKFAEHVVCEDEFKYALLANNCLYPGLSTLVTLILQTSRGKEGELAEEQWQKVYGRHSGNEIYHIQLSRSIFFHTYEGKTFTQASAAVHQSLGVCLLAVLDMTEMEPYLKLNPGPDYILKGTDICFYMSLTKEEYSRVITPLGHETTTSEERNKNIDRLVAHLREWLQSEGDEEYDTDEESVFSTITKNVGSTLSKKLKSGFEGIPLLNPTNLISTGDMNQSMDKSDDVVLERMYEHPYEQLFHRYGMFTQDDFITGPLPSTMAVGTKRILCHLHNSPLEPCCIKWGEECKHCPFKKANDDCWENQLIILSVEICSQAIYNFIVPLRSSYLSLASLSPIIIMTNQEPDDLFLETIAYFPLVFWMRGSLKSLDDLLRAGIRKAHHLVISHIEGRLCGHSEESLEDAETIVMVQKISGLFPSVNIITEMNEATNMRFMHFQARDSYFQEISRLEKRLKEKTTSNLPYMFRLPFAAGQVFSSAMLDRLLYQTFVKGYLISFVRLLLGIDAQVNSGHLSSVRVMRATIEQFPTYGDLYQGLCSTTGEIPMAIYRTEKRSGSSNDVSQENNIENSRFSKGRPSVPSFIFTKAEHSHQNLSNLINARLQRLNLSSNEPYVIKKPRKTISYVIVNPSPSRKLKHGDIIYVIQPYCMLAIPNKLKRRTVARNSNISKTSGSKLRHESDPLPDDGSKSPVSGSRGVSWRIGPKVPLRKYLATRAFIAADRTRSKSESSAEILDGSSDLQHPS